MWAWLVSGRRTLDDMKAYVRSRLVLPAAAVQAAIEEREAAVRLGDPEAAAGAAVRAAELELAAAPERERQQAICNAQLRAEMRAMMVTEADANARRQLDAGDDDADELFELECDGLS